MASAAREHRHERAMTNIERVQDDSRAAFPSGTRCLPPRASRGALRSCLLGTIALLSTPFTTTVLARQEGGASTESGAGMGESSAFPGRTAAASARSARGATAQTEEAVLEGLRWLLRHQNGNGSWGADSSRSHCSPDRPCIPTGGPDYD